MKTKLMCQSSKTALLGMCALVCLSMMAQATPRELNPQEQQVIKGGGGPPAAPARSCLTCGPAKACIPCTNAGAGNTPPRVGAVSWEATPYVGKPISSAIGPFGVTVTTCTGTIWGYTVANCPIGAGVTNAGPGTGEQCP